MSGFLKSSSWSPQARSMARAPARCAPSISARLRVLGKESFTAESPRWSSTTPILVIANPTKKGHHPGVDDGRESFRWCCSRPPSSACCPPYEDGNSYNNREYDSGSFILRENPIVCDGDARHRCSPSK